MSRDDVALLVFRVVALWFGSGSASLLVSTVSGSSVLYLDHGSFIAAAALRHWDAGVMGSPTDAGHEVAQRGASIAADFAIGVVLIVLSRRRDLWATGDRAAIVDKAN